MNPTVAHLVPRVTVFTPTYNRAHTLGRVYESLRCQSFRDFEWIIVDDGSTDATAELVMSWQQSGTPFPLRYFFQNNAGKHIAHNHALKHARGEYFSILDSDDAYTPDALRVLIGAWESIPAEQRAAFANVEGLCVDPAGQLIGTRFPDDVFDSDAFSIRWQRRGPGDTQGMYRTAVLREFPFPDEYRRCLVSESLVWNRIAGRYRTRFINRVTGCKEYMPAGLSRSGAINAAANLEPKLLYYHELLAMRRPMPPGFLLRAGINYTRLALHRGRSVIDLLRRSPRKTVCLAMAPIGAVLFLRDVFRRDAQRS